MPSLLTDRGEFVGGAAVLGTGLGVLSLVYTERWGWIVAVVMLPALIVRARWQSMPGWLLLAWLTVPTVIGDAFVVTHSAYMVVVVGMAVVAADRRTRADLVAMLACLFSPFLIWALETNNWHRGIGAWLWFSGLLIGWGFGHVVARQFALIDELERTRNRLADIAVTEDRQRIARDLHDLVGHSFSVVLLHLSGARLLIPSSPAEAEQALRQAEAVGRAGMDELRQALSLMHHGSPALPPVELDQLLATYRQAGMSLDVEVRGDMTAVAAAPRIVLHDVLRESLTNVAKHARTADATIGIVVDRDGLLVRVSSELRPGPAHGRGVGLAGLDHRVAAIGGSFQAHPDEGRWVVEAVLPRRLAGVPA